ncbi:MAG: biotin--[acetyl-CoA-carboxylase] ligase [Syntrophus sp. (in: bacteria)]|nr:biotin--[acetyl-CoA-carboxylase] ligase [Syntrophus sp. (in: bacteria)]
MQSEAVWRCMADLAMDSREFDAEALKSRLAGRRMGWRIHYLPVVDSTNRLALKLVREGAAEGTVVFADCQTSGRGRLQRVWQSPPGRNLYASFLLRPAIAPAEAARITLMAGVAVAEMISIFCPAGVGLKWPNDVCIQGRKVCGILTEMKTTGRALDGIVVGIGLNVNITGEDFDPVFRKTATSLREETGRIFPREEVAVLLCDSFEKWYRIFLGEGFAPVREKWLSRSGMTGRRVRVLFQGEAQEGVVVGIDDDGALLLEDELGAVRRIIAGDASIVKG